MDSFLLVSTLWSALKRRALFVTAVFVSASVGSIAYLVVTPPTYVSRARIMLTEGEEAVVSDLGRSLTESQLDSPGAGADPLATQSELITSEAVYSKTLERLEADGVSESKVSQGFSGWPLSVILDENLRVRVIPATNILELRFSHRDPKIAADILNAIVQTTAEINGENIRKEASQIRIFLEEQLPQQEARLTEAEDAERKFRQESGIVSLDQQVTNLVNSLGDLEREERQIAAQLRELDEKAGLLQNITGADAIEDAYESVQIGQDETLNNLRTRLVDLEASIVETGSRLGDQHPDLQALLEQREEMQLLYQRQLDQRHNGLQSRDSEYRAISPSSQDLMNQLISDRIEYGSLSERLAGVQSEIEALRERLLEIPSLSQPLGILVRRRENAEETLRNLRLNLEEAKLAEAQLVSNITILGEASVPGAPSAPSKPAVLFLGVVSGLVLAGSLLVLLEAMDNTLHTAEEAKAWLGYPVLGELPAHSAEDFALNSLEGFLNEPKFVSSYHSLLNNLRYSLALDANQDLTSFEVSNNPIGLFEVGLPEARAKTILLSSAFRGECKSLVARNLAAVSATLGHRTLLIDADLLSGHQTSFFNLNGRRGLSDLTGLVDSYLDACHMTHIENLSVLPIGSSNTQPAAIMDSSLLKEIIGVAANHYDSIILDAPTITESPTCISLSQYTGGLFLVVRPDFKSKHELRRVTSDFIQSGGKLFGQILNRQGDPESELNVVNTPVLENMRSEVLSSRY